MASILKEVIYRTTVEDSSGSSSDSDQSSGDCEYGCRMCRNSTSNAIKSHLHMKCGRRANAASRRRDWKKLERMVFAERFSEPFAKQVGEYSAREAVYMESSCEDICQMHRVASKRKAHHRASSPDRSNVEMKEDRMLRTNEQPGDAEDLLETAMKKIRRLNLNADYSVEGLLTLRETKKKAVVKKQSVVNCDESEEELLPVRETNKKAVVEKRSIANSDESEKELLKVCRNHKKAVTEERTIDIKAQHSVGTRRIGFLLVQDGLLMCVLCAKSFLDPKCALQHWRGQRHSWKLNLHARKQEMSRRTRTKKQLKSFY